MDELPEEILEIIFSNVSPYKEYDTLSAVCKKWKRILNGMNKQLPINFENYVASGAIEWFKVEECSQSVVIAPRIAQVACYNDYTKSMFVFGGRSFSSSSSGFNDLIQLDLNSLTWMRPVVKGAVPPPKFNSVFESYKTYLILFGGSSLPPNNTLGRGSAKYTNDLYVYNIKSGTWTVKSFLPANCPPEMYLPQSCILMDDDDDSSMDTMVVYGGQKMALLNQTNKELWCLNLETWVWQKQTLVGEPSPDSFFETSKSVICHLRLTAYSMALMILPHSPYTFCAWLLFRSGWKEWTWKKIEILSGQYSPFFNLHQSIAQVQVGNKLVLFGNMCSEEYKPQLHKVSELRILKTSATTNVKTVRMKKNILNVMNSCSPGTSVHANTKGLYIFLLDLQNIETENAVKWINQLDPIEQKLRPSFVGKEIPSNVTAVLGKGEIILHSAVKHGKKVCMSLYIVRGYK
ncbi:F-box only protein 42-like [Clavelina lepadiformis]|uniref:F-box only protein 42-like n=1 Tax=Clavelina lepadiformis TaxID=159417 RepID=UPI0040437358